MFIRTAGERDLVDIGALLAETWHATYDPIYGAAGVAENAADRLPVVGADGAPAGVIHLADLTVDRP